MTCQIRRWLSALLLLGAVVLAMLIALGVLPLSNAAAAIRQLEESPGQMVYQSRQRLTDQYGHSWHAIAFKRVRPNGAATVELRLVGFPGLVELDHSQPLTLTNSLGQAWVASVAIADVFSDHDHPEANVSQYDLQPLLPDLAPGIPLSLSLPTTSNAPIHLSIPPSLIAEWQAIGSG